MDFKRSWLLLFSVAIWCICTVEGENWLKSVSKEECVENNPADLVFVLDESGSIWGPDFKRQLEFVLELIGEFRVEEGGTHIGVLTFGDVPKVHVNLGDYTDTQHLKWRVGNITQARGGTKTYDAIETMYNEMFSPNWARPGLPHVCILITDGASENMVITAAEAQKARDDGITMFAIGVGQNINPTELENIASKPASVYVSRVGDYGALDALKEMLAWEVCQITTLPPPTTTTTTTTTTPTTTLPQMIEGCEGHEPADILFALPDQGDIDGMDCAVDFVANLVRNVELSPRKVQVGMTPRQCEQGDAVNLNDHDTVLGLSRAFDARRYSYSRTDSHLYYMRTQGTNGRNGAREDSVKIGILIVDNQSLNSRRTLKEADRAKADGIQLIVIGVGPHISRDELEQIATDSSSLFLVSDHCALQSIMEQVRHRICAGLMGMHNLKRMYMELLEDLYNY